MPQFYLGTNTVDGVYLGAQNVCDAFVGVSQALDNCAYTPSTLVLSTSQISVSGTNTSEGTSYYFTITPGYSQSGQPGTTGSFTTVVNANSPYTISSTTLPTTTTGTFPTSGSTTIYAQGSIVIAGGPVIPTTRNNYNLDDSGAPQNTGTSISPDYSTGPAESLDSTSITIELDEDPNYENYNPSLSGPGTLSRNTAYTPPKWIATFQPGINYPTAVLTPVTTNYYITGSASLITFSRTFSFIDTASNSDTNVTWNISGSNIISNTNGTQGTLATGGTTNSTVTFTGSVTGSISVSASGGNTLGTVTYGAEGSSATETTSSPPTTVLEVVTAPTTPIIYSSSWINQGGSPFSTQLAACTDANSATSGNATVYYTGSIESGLLYTGSNLSGQLSGGWYYDWSAGEVGYYTYGSGWSGYGGC